MIQCRLSSARGGQVSRETLIEAGVIDIGRDAACHLLLPDHRVAGLHARLLRDAAGRLCIEAYGAALVSIDGYLERSSPLRQGMRIAIGPYRLRVTMLDPAGTLDLMLEQSGPETAAIPPPPLLPTSLAALGMRKWQPGLALAVLILVLTGVAYWTGQRAQPSHALGLLLNPAPLSAGHRQLDAQCATCHQAAFAGVRDQVCTQCHGTMAVHLPAGDSGHERQPDPPPCVGCHALHAGKAAARSGGMPACEDCHRQALEPARQASDFATHHPPFRLAIPHGDKTVRIVPEATAKESSGLKFPHQLHLAKGGIKSPLGNTELACASCHRPAPDGEHFEPIDMAVACQQSQCHRLRLSSPAQGVIPHGSERAVMQHLQEFFRQRLAAASPAAVRQACPRPAGGAAGTPLQQGLECAAEQAQQHAAATLFRTTGKNPECGLCHEIGASPQPGQPGRIAPLHRRHDWQPAATFSHTRHRTQACTACHDKSGSKSSADIAFPTRETCRTCHDGPVAGTGKIASPCESCHRYHRHMPVAGETAG